MKQIENVGHVYHATLSWKVNTIGLLNEIMSNNNMGILDKPIKIFASLLDDIATRASELNDPVLNAIMCQLALYEIANPVSPEYDSAKANAIIDAASSITQGEL